MGRKFIVLLEFALFVMAAVAFFVWLVLSGAAAESPEIYENGYRAIPAAVQCFDDADSITKITSGEFSVPKPNVRYQVLIAEEAMAFFLSQNWAMALVAPPKRTIVQVCVLTRTSIVE